MKVQAITDGFYGGVRQRAGTVFEVKDGVTSKWFTPVAAKEAVSAKATKPKQKKDDAVALSQLPEEQTPASDADPALTSNVSDKDVI
jgi:hypothetical protein